MVLGFNTFVNQALQHNPSADITREIRQCFDTTQLPPVRRSAEKKIEIRNDVIYKPVRSNKAWKRKYNRHKQQATCGFFSAVATPYQTFGLLELDLRDLVVQTLGKRAFQLPHYEDKKKHSMWSKLREDGQLTNALLGGGRNKSGKKETYVCTNMTTVICDKLSVMKDRVVALRAGQSYNEVLRKEGRKKRLEILEEQKTEMQLTLQSAPSFIRKKSVMASRKSVASSEEVTGLEETDKIDIIELQLFHRRKCRNFAAMLKALYSLMCSVYQLKTRDLRTKAPLSKDYVKVLSHDVPLDSKGKPVRCHRVQCTTTQNTSESDDSFHIRGSDSVHVTSNAAFAGESTTAFYRPPPMESGYSLQDKPLTNVGTKRFKSTLTKSSEEPPETGSSQENRPGPSRSSTFHSTFYTVLGGVKAKRGNFLGMITNTINTADLPLWQQVAANEKQDRKPRPGPIAPPKKTEKNYNYGTLVEQLNRGFAETQSRCSKQLSEDMIKLEKLEKVSFRRKLKGLKMSRLLERDLMAMRRKTNRLQQEYDDDNLRPTWFDALLDQAQELEVEDDYDVDNLLQKITPFSRDDITTVSYVKPKLCLLFQSLPLYDLCQISMLDALKFFLESILKASPNTLSDWLVYRKIKPLESDL